LEAVAGFRSALSRLLNSPAENFCPQVNLSSALTKILQSLPLNGPRDTIVYTEEDFPSIGFVLQQARRFGYRLRAIPSSTETTDAAQWDSALDESTALVMVTHVHSNTGRQVPVENITRNARERGVISVVDIAQSAGCIPIDLQAWSADFVIGSCVKWLCGGPGAGFLWVRPELQVACEPIDVGWFSHENPFEFDIHDFRYAGNADRFWGGTPSVQPFVVAANSIHTICDIGVQTIRSHNLALTQRLIDALPPASVATPTPAEQRGGTLVIGLDKTALEAAAKRLEASKVLFDLRPTGIRLSPHIYNDASEIDVAAQCLGV
jgi:selenocysteine lyase/cysteine desulfurase